MNRFTSIINEISGSFSIYNKIEKPPLINAGIRYPHSSNRIDITPLHFRIFTIVLLYFISYVLT
jgi:hypothetical protein